MNDLVMKPFPFVDRLSLEKFDKTKPRFDHMHKPKLFFPFYTLTTRGNLILIKFAPPNLRPDNT